MSVKSKDIDRKPVWRRPLVQELGNLRDFVRTGNALGKSHVITDGASMAGNESMNFFMD
jgi:hypothetical protein